MMLKNLVIFVVQEPNLEDKIKQKEITDVRNYSLK